jgi:autotransporter-associated beta strand protein
MKLYKLKLALVIGVTAFLCTHAVQAAVLTWDADTSIDGAQDGSGTWTASISNTNWWDGTTNVSWDGITPANAIFGSGNATSNNPTVAIANSTTIIVSNITFNSGGIGNYTISAGNSSSRLSLWQTPTITVASGVSATNLVIVSGTSFTKMGGGTLVLKPSNPYVNTGSTVVGDGMLIVGSSNGRQLIPGNLTITNGATAKLGAAEQIADSAIVTVDGGIFDTAGKAETIAGLILDHDGQILSASSGVAITNNGTAFDLRSGIIFPNLAGTAGLTKTTTGTVILTNGSGVDTFTGPVLISEGTLILGHSSSSANYALPATTITITNAGVLTEGKDNQINPAATVLVAGGTYELAAHNETVATLTLENGGSILNGGNNSKTLTVNSAMDFQDGYCFSKLAGSAPLTKTTSGTVTIAGDGTYIGGTLISAGILQLGDGTTNNRGKLGIGSVQNDSALVLNHAGAFTLDNPISGSGSLTNLGGSASLTGANSYTGGTTVSGGTLLVNSGTGTGAVNVRSGGALGGVGSIDGAVNVLAGGNLTPLNSGIGVFTINGKLTLNASSTSTFNVDGAALANDAVALGSTVNYGGQLNIVPNGTFTVGQQFVLFSGAGAANAGNFTSISGSPGLGMAFAFTNGILSVVSASTSEPPTLSFSKSSGSLDFSWTDPSFKLQWQTNGLNSVWSDYPGGNVSPVNVTIDPAIRSAFFRLSQ